MSKFPPVQVIFVSADAQLRQLAQHRLNGGSYFLAVEAGMDGFHRARKLCECHIAVIDADLPGDQAFELAAFLRLSSNIGVVMLTRADVADVRIEALAAGADLCVNKPLDMRELAAALDALERRLGPRPVAAATPAVPAAPAVAPPSGATGSRWHLSNGDWILNDPSGRQIELTRLERAFVKCLFDNLYEPVSRERLITAMGGDPYEYAPHRIDVLASRLRRKASEQGISLALRSVRGTGYTMMA